MKKSRPLIIVPSGVGVDRKGRVISVFERARVDWNIFKKKGEEEKSQKGGGGH